MSLPNLITLGRLLLVPWIVWAVASNEMFLAFVLFVVAGVSDGIDGFIAKRFDMKTELGAYLDPLADKALLVAIYVSLAIAGELPRWLVILVVSRDIMIVGAIMLSWIMSRPVEIRPHIVSKLNTAAQIVLASLVLASLGLGIPLGHAFEALVFAVAVLTSVSALAYLRAWMRHMADGPA